MPGISAFITPTNRFCLHILINNTFNGIISDGLFDTRLLLAVLLIAGMGIVGIWMGLARSIPGQHYVLVVRLPPQKGQRKHFG